LRTEIEDDDGLMHFTNIAKNRAILS
jgi:hypothetical protein